MLCSKSHKKIEVSKASILQFCGKRGIRTPEPFQVNGFQDRRDRPLRHLSSFSYHEIGVISFFAVQN